MIGRLVRLVVVVGRWLQRIRSRDEAPRGGGPALDRALGLDDDELDVEAAERGLAGRDRDEWIEERRGT